MKKSYYIVASLIAIELILMRLSVYLGFEFNSLSLFLQDIIVLISIFPICWFFFLLSKDAKIKKKIRVFFKIAMWHLIICYIVVIIGLYLQAH